MKPKKTMTEKQGEKHQENCLCFVTEDGCICEPCGGIKTCSMECPECYPQTKSIKNNPTDPRIEERIKYRHKRECEVVTGIECVDCHANLQQELTACADAARKETLAKAQDALDEVFYTANPGNSVLTEFERVEISANNAAVRHCIRIIAELAKPKGER